MKIKVIISKSMCLSMFLLNSSSYSVEQNEKYSSLTKIVIENIDFSTEPRKVGFCYEMDALRIGFNPFKSVIDLNYSSQHIEYDIAFPRSGQKRIHYITQWHSYLVITPITFPTEGEEDNSYSGSVIMNSKIIGSQEIHITIFKNMNNENSHWPLCQVIMNPLTLKQTVALCVLKNMENNNIKNHISLLPKDLIDYIFVEKTLTS